MWDLILYSHHIMEHCRLPALRHPSALRYFLSIGLLNQERDCWSLQPVRKLHSPAFRYQRWRRHRLHHQHNITEKESGELSDVACCKQPLYHQILLVRDTASIASRVSQAFLLHLAYWNIFTIITDALMWRNNSEKSADCHIYRLGMWLQFPMQQHIFAKFWRVIHVRFLSSK